MHFALSFCIDLFKWIPLDTIHTLFEVLFPAPLSSSLSAFNQCLSLWECRRNQHLALTMWNTCQEMWAPLSLLKSYTKAQCTQIVFWTLHCSLNNKTFSHLTLECKNIKPHFFLDFFPVLLTYPLIVFSSKLSSTTERFSRFYWILLC